MSDEDIKAQWIEAVRQNQYADERLQMIFKASSVPDLLYPRSTKVGISFMDVNDSVEWNDASHSNRLFSFAEKDRILRALTNNALYISGTVTFPSDHGRTMRPELGGYHTFIENFLNGKDVVDATKLDDVLNQIRMLRVERGHDFLLNSGKRDDEKEKQAYLDSIAAIDEVIVERGGNIKRTPNSPAEAFLDTLQGLKKSQEHMQG